ncbi:MAG: hypothetical protein U0869_16915 [Chloroflexota bacterium]
MKSRLITALAIGALSVGMVPGLASAQGTGFDCYTQGGLEPANANCHTVVDVYVSSGSTLFVPATVHINTAGTDEAAFPGQTISNEAAQEDQNSYVEWWSNEAEKTVNAQLDGPLSKGTNPDPILTIAASNAHIWLHGDPDDSDQGALSNKVAVGTIDEVTDHTNTSRTRQYFYMKLFIPSADEGNYSQNMTWTVDDLVQ